MNRSIDKLLLNPIRLKIISTLISVNECDFNYLKKITESTQGNLSIQLKKLKEHDYINIEKKFENNKYKSNIYFDFITFEKGLG